MNKQLAKVSKATLQLQERGILMFWIFVDYEEGCSQGIGGLCLDEYDKEKKARVGTAYGCEMIRRALDVFSVDDFSEMKGKYIWVLGEGEGFSFKPKGLQSLAVDGKVKTFIFEDVYNQFVGE
jgi:hypothetical protein